MYEVNLDRRPPHACRETSGMGGAGAVGAADGGGAACLTVSTSDPEVTSLSS